MSVVGTIFGGATSTSALDTASRLFEVLTIDNDDGTGLFYIDISQNIKMPTHDLTA
jgi:hypothetical protein